MYYQDCPLIVPLLTIPGAPHLLCSFVAGRSSIHGSRHCWTDSIALTQSLNLHNTHSRWRYPTHARSMRQQGELPRRESIPWWAVAAGAVVGSTAAAVVIMCVRRRRAIIDSEAASAGSSLEARAAMLAERRRLLGPNLSVSFADSRPLCVVRGEGAYLFDADGTR